MTTEMFGTPYGTRAAEEDQRQNLHSQITSMLGGLQAQEIMGKIAAQPAANDLTAAHARYYKAAAAEHEQKASEVEAMNRLAMEAANSPEIPLTGPQQPQSLATPLEKLYNLGVSKGMFKAVMPVAEKISLIRQREAQAGSARAAQVQHETKAEEQLWDLKGSLAMSAIDPTSYAQMRMVAQNRGIDMGQLPEDFAAAKPYLASLITQSMKAKDVIAEKRRQAVATAEIGKLGAQAGAASQAAVTAKAREKVLTQTYDLRAKNDGDMSPSVTKLREARTKAAEARTAALGQETDAQRRLRESQDALKFPPPTPAQIADPKRLEIGRAYSTPKGVMKWTGAGWIPLHEPRLVAPAAAADDETDDDTGE